MADDPDPRTNLLKELQAHADEDAVAVLDAGYLGAAEQCVNLWRTRWFAGPIAVARSLEIKFRMCFPLAAHALNHVEAALELREQRPWVAAASARVSFEHALAAQWVLLTIGGEQELLNWMNSQRHLRAKEFAAALVRGIAHPRGDALALDAAQRQALVGNKPDASGWSVFNACGRFADTTLFYDIYRNLSQAEHPSIGLIAAHLSVTATGPQQAVSAAGALKPSDEVPLALAMSALWALHVLEELREGQPHIADVERVGASAQLPADLRASDRHPERQRPPVEDADSS